MVVLMLMMKNDINSKRLSAARRSDIRRSRPTDKPELESI